MDNWIEQIDQCTECDRCMDVCPTYSATGEYLFSPRGRLESARGVLSDGRLGDRIIESFYNCPKCMACESVCPQDIEISRIVGASRAKIVDMGQGPLDPHKKIISGIEEKGNSVNGDPAKRLDWLPEPYEPRESDTLFMQGAFPVTW